MYTVPYQRSRNAIESATRYDKAHGGASKKICVRLWNWTLFKRLEKELQNHQKHLESNPHSLKTIKENVVAFVAQLRISFGHL